MLRHTSIHTYNIPEETNPLSGYVLCVWSEHGRTRLLNTPGGAQRECRQPLFSTLQQRCTQTQLPFPCSFCLRIVSVGVPVMDTVSDLWTFRAASPRPASPRLASPRIVFLLALWSPSILCPFLFCSTTVAARTVEYYIYTCSPSACVPSPPESSAWPSSFSLSLSLRPLR